MTFSIVGRSKDGKELGVAVASKFLGVGAFVPAGRADIGALATQAYGNLALRTQGLDLLSTGLDPADMLEKFLADDPQKNKRQVGVVDTQGRAATFTGNACLPWAGGKAETLAHGSYAAQANLMAGPDVVEAMATTWKKSDTELPLADRLVQALAAGQAAGGDPRGQQSAAVLVVAAGRGYGGLSDIAVDLRSDDSPQPIAELERMIKLHTLYFGVTPSEELILPNEVLIEEITALLQQAGLSGEDMWKDLYYWMSNENYEERWHDGKIDPVVLEQLRAFQPRS